ncbi:MAG: hypothetical protein KJO43_07120 [Phycisphaerae bacterium]|nr:hypothetical protein [Phycisphaerae bacterium]
MSWRPVRRACASIAVPIVLALTALLTPRVSAQGTDGALADPITTSELRQYADRLGLSPQQRQAFESLHDEYKLTFRVLRDGEIADFLSRTRGLQGGMMPERKVVAEIFEDIERLQGKIRRIDDSLFDRLPPLLTDTQAALVPRVRMQRERTRYEAQQMLWATGRKPADLSALFRKLELTPETLAVTDPMIAAYEHRLTTQMRKLSESTGRMYLDMFDMIEQLGLGDLDMEEAQRDPEQLRQLMEAMQQVWREITIRMQKVVGEIEKLNQRTYRSVRSMLPPDDAAAYRLSYLGAAYPEIAPLAEIPVLTRLDEALQRLKLAPEDEEAVRTSVTDFGRQLDGIIDESTALIDEHRSTFSPFDFNSEAMQEYQRKLQTLRGKASELQQRVVKTVGELVGEETLAKLLAAPTETEAADVAATPAAGAAASVEAVAEEPAIKSISGDPLLPPQATRADLRYWSDDLGLSADERIVVEELFNGYIERFKALPELASLRTARQSMWSYDAESGLTSPPTEAVLDQVRLERERAFAAIMQLENAFFDDVAAVLGEDRIAMVEQVRRQRERARYQRTTAPTMFGGRARNARAGVDLVDLVTASDLDADVRETLTPIVDRYVTATLPVLREQREAQLALQHAQDTLTAMQTRAQMDDETGLLVAARYQEIVGPPGRRLKDAARRLAEVNKEFLAEFSDALPPAERDAFTRAYRVDAYPKVYKDPVCVDTHLTGALKLADLTTDQRESLAEIAATYRPEYERLSNAMVELVSKGGMDPTSFEPDDWREYQKRTGELQRLAYDRNELSARAASRLEMVLRPQQLAELGPLPKPEEADRFSVGW